MENDVKKIQKRLLLMAKNVCAILEKNDIPYMITLGTLLGAVRHHGFIPWDDDFDIHMFDESYEEGISVLRSMLPSWLFVEDEKSEPLYFHGWAHVKDMNSTVRNGLFPQDDVYAHNGISLDLYRLDRVRLADVQKYINNQNEAYIMRRHKKGVISDTEYEQRIKRLQIDRQYDNSEVKGNPDRIVYGMVSIYKQKYIEIADVEPLKRYEFEDTSFWGPANADRILQSIYGDYWEYPPVENRRSHITELRIW